MATSQSSQSITEQERDFLVSHLKRTRKMFLESIAGLSQAQLSFKPSDGSWSIAECAEHIAISEDIMFYSLTENIMTSPAAPEKRAEVKGQDELVFKFFAERSRKGKAPEPFKPIGRWPTMGALTKHFNESRDRTIAYAQTAQDDLRSHFAYRPNWAFLKVRDAYQYLLSIPAHAERHIMQINEIKTHSNFPKN